MLGRAVTEALEEAFPGTISATRAEADVTDRFRLEAEIERLRPDVVINCAAYTDVDGCEIDRDRARRVNAEGAGNAAIAAASADSRIVHVSTDFVFDGHHTVPYTEDDPPAPLSEYGRTKLDGERRVAAATPEHLIVRTSWVFGEGRNFVRAVLHAAAAGSGEDLPVVDDQRGRPTYAVDLAAGILALVEREAEGTYHLQGGGEPGTWADVAEAALAAAGMPVKVRRITTADYDAGRAGPRGRPRGGADGGPIARRPANGVLDCSKAAACGVALRPWREAIDAYVRVMP